MDFKVKKSTYNFGSFIRYVFISFILIVSGYPILWMVLNSFKTNQAIFADVIKLPIAFDFNIFLKAWKAAEFTVAFRNSIIVTFAAIAIILIVGSLAAFGLSHMDFKLKNFFLSLFIGAQIISGQIILLPLFKLMKDLRLLGNLASLIIVNSAMGLPLSIFLLWGFFRGLSREIYDAAKIDGCNNFNYYLRFVLPLSKPIVAGIVIFQSLFIWNEYLFALTFTNKPAVRTIPLQLQVFFTAYSRDYQLTFAGLTMAIIPILLIYLFTQKFFIKGLLAGSIKE
jgi:raffinose/stachyose/melibiose transport system permease protein